MFHWSKGFVFLPRLKVSAGSSSLGLRPNIISYKRGVLLLPPATENFFLKVFFIDPRTTTHKLGGHLDQIFDIGDNITYCVVNDGFDSWVTDQKCLKVSLLLKYLLTVTTN